MTHLNTALYNIYDLKTRLGTRRQDEEGALSLEWLALAAAIVVVLGIVATTFGNPIGQAISNAFSSIAGDASDISGD